MEVSLVFPHQLFENHPALTKKRDVLLIEDELFFSQYNFHKQKLVLHRASMKSYHEHLVKKGFRVSYFDYNFKEGLAGIFENLVQQGVKKIHHADPVDYLLERRLKRFSRRAGIDRELYPSPQFLCTKSFLDEYFASSKRYFQTDFYIALRKEKGILIGADKPIGGAWTFDTQNRKRLPKLHAPPAPPSVNDMASIREAQHYVASHFPHNHGTESNFRYPVTFHEAQRWLEKFIEERLHAYGDYQDAIDTEQSFLYHSILSPALNIGLLTPEIVLEKVIEAFNEHQIPLNSAEGFIRQVLGWREYIRAVYQREGTRQRTTNYFKHTRKIPSSFYQGNTGIQPVDNIIRRLHSTAYANHIERLMIAGNFMLLCEFDPDEVYRWFMELFIDAYDWVMVPNVYGMSQYADKGLMSTKPYISGSNYLLKMSHYKKENWASTWDALYWRFINQHTERFSKNPRMKMMVSLWQKKNRRQQKQLLSVAENFLSQIS